jgi:Beta-lactamase
LLTEMVDINKIVLDAVEVALRRGEIGVQVAAYVNGELVADVWGGLADEASGRKVDGDTLFPVFSVTKAVTATALHIQSERGLIDYDQPISRYWPQFGAKGQGQGNHPRRPDASRRYSDDAGRGDPRADVRLGMDGRSACPGGTGVRTRSNERLSLVHLRLDHRGMGAYWLTDSTPVDNTKSDDAGQQVCKLEPPLAGSIFRFAAIPPEDPNVGPEER